MENVVRLLSTLALMGAVRHLTDRYEAEQRTRIDADFAPTLALLDRLRGGEVADVVVLTREGLDDLAAEGMVVAVILRESFVFLNESGYAALTSERKRLTCPASSLDCEDSCSAAPST